MALTAMDNGSRPLGWGEGGAANIFQTLVARINWADIASHTGGVSSDGVYHIFDLPAGAFLTRCYLVIETLFVGSTATVAINESTGTSMTLLSATDLADGTLTAGSVFVAPSGDGSDILSNVASHADNFDTSARTITWTTGTAAFTAGEAVLIVEYGVIPQ